MTRKVYEIYDTVKGVVVSSKLMSKRGCQKRLSDLYNLNYPQMEQPDISRYVVREYELRFSSNMMFNKDSRKLMQATDMVEKLYG